MCPDMLVSKVGRSAPILFGINICSPGLAASWRLAEFIRKQWPHSYIVAGGSHPTGSPESLLHESSPFHFVVQGSGEKAIILIAEALSSANIITPQCPGLFVNDWVFQVSEVDKKSTTGRLEGSISEANTLLPVPDYSLFDTEKYLNVRPELPVYTGKGCIFRCRYCSIAAVLGSEMNRRPIPEVIAELEKRNEEYGCTSFKFITEDLVSGNKSYFRELVSALYRHPIPFRWRCQLRIDSLKPDDISLMAEAGCEEILFSIDAVYERAQMLSGRRVRLAKIMAMARLVVESGMNPQVSFILGFPGETEGEALETLNFAIEMANIGVNQVTFWPLLLFPGTALWKDFGNGELFGGLQTPSSWLGKHGSLDEYLEKYGMVPEPQDETDAKRIARVIEYVALGYRSCTDKKALTASSLGILLSESAGRREWITNSLLELKAEAYSALPPSMQCEKLKVVTLDE